MGCCNCKEGHEFIFSPRNIPAGNERISFGNNGKFNFANKENQITHESANAISNPFLLRKTDPKNDTSIISDRTNTKLFKEEKENLRYQNGLNPTKNADATQPNTKAPSPASKQRANNLKQNLEEMKSKGEANKLEKETKVTDSVKNDYDSSKQSSKKMKIEASPKGSHKVNLESHDIKDEIDKNYQSRNEKLFANQKKVSNNATVLSGFENPTMGKDFTLDSNMMSTNRDQAFRDKILRLDQKIVSDNANKSSVSNISQQQDKKQEEDLKASTVKIEKTPTTNSQIDNKRAKFFEKMNGMIKNMPKELEKENEKKGLSHTMKPEMKKSINMNSLIQNLENHMKGEPKKEETSQAPSEGYVNLILEKPATKTIKKKALRPEFK